MKTPIISAWLPCAALLLALSGCAGSAQKETAGEFIDDSVITAKVKTALVDDPSVSALHINVETNKGVVQLKGVARDPQESWKAADLARHVSGVRGVRNDIVVR